MEEDDRDRDDELRRKIEQYNQVMRPAREKEGRERRSRRQGEGRGEGHKRKIRTTITQAKLDEMNMIFSKYQEYREVVISLCRPTRMRDQMTRRTATSNTVV